MLKSKILWGLVDLKSANPRKFLVETRQMTHFTTSNLLCVLYVTKQIQITTRTYNDIYYICLQLYALDCVPPSGSFSLRVVAIIIVIHRDLGMFTRVASRSWRNEKDHGYRIRGA